MKLPGFIIIGAQRCGTTSLYNYLIDHPGVGAATRKEVHYFDLYYDKGLDWYLTNFPEREAAAVTGEASPYYLFHPHAPRRVWQTMPHVKLIVLLRDPVDRAFSHFHHEVRLQRETLSFEEALATENERLRGEVDKILANENYHSFNHRHFSYLSRGVYADQLSAWTGLFPRDQMLLLRSEDLYKDPFAAFSRVTRFLGLPAHRPARMEKHNELTYQPMNPATKASLRKSFLSHNQRLREEFDFEPLWD